ncbi:MAG: low specificity L-threonine aldolase [Chitinophagaceae bacterium]|nr:low specificity L-threonine aldolase [Chitinophagaceae bacterium]MCB9045495.1 low specificity L-threonine aldolase [Chitinophagales bacterium]
MKGFASDNYAGVLPEIMEALYQANMEHARSYGADDITAGTIDLFREVFGTNVEVHFVFNGTGANVLSMSACTRSFNSVLCAETSHMYWDESTAPETFTGCRFVPVRINEEGKLTPAAIAERLIRKGDMHFAQPAVVSITQSTEYATVYTQDELKAIGDLTKTRGLYYHMDGARFFNAAASLGCSVKEMSTDVGLDILSLGGTKAGMMYGEAVVVFNPELSEYINYKHKQSMQLASKTRFISAQFGALLKDDLWNKHAGHANAMAQLLKNSIADIPGVNITKPVNANGVFAIHPEGWNKAIWQQYPYYVWDEHTNEVRLMCSWDTTEEEVVGFAELMRSMEQ